jgi:FkbM family methyltransferase
MTHSPISRLLDPQPRIVVVDSIFGPLAAFENDFATNQIVKFGAHTRNEIALLRSFVDEGELVYDIGAHIGGFAIPLAAAAGVAGRVVAVEADTQSFPLLWRNLSSRGLIGRVAPVCGLAGGLEGGHKPIRVPDHTSATYFVPDADGESAIAFQVDDLHACFGGGRKAAVIKIDVEGMELAVLRSATRTIERDRPILYVEIAVEQMARYAVAPSEIDTFLRGRDYRIFRNVGERNSTNDTFELVELANLTQGGAFFDVLAIPAESGKIARASGAGHR